MSHKTIRLVAVIGASAVVTIGAAAVGISQDRSSLDTDASPGMSTGATITASVAPKVPAVSQAKPAIKGPAPLPPEEQGLPG